MGSRRKGKLDALRRLVAKGLDCTPGAAPPVPPPTQEAAQQGEVAPRAPAARGAIEDFRSLRSNAPTPAALLERFAVTKPPVDVTAMARRLGLTVEWLEMEGRAGGLDARGGRGQGRIIVRASDPPARQRFTIAVALYYALNKPDGAYARSASDEAAMSFAAELLMPDVLLRPQLEYRLRPAVPELAGLFEVSRDALERRLEAYSLEFLWKDDPFSVLEMPRNPPPTQRTIRDAEAALLAKHDSWERLYQSPEEQGQAELKVAAIREAARFLSELQSKGRFDRERRDHRPGGMSRDVLARAREVLVEHGWTPWETAVDEAGNRIDWAKPEAARFSIVGAVYKAAMQLWSQPQQRTIGAKAALSWLARTVELRSSDLQDWNKQEGRSVEEVLGLIERTLDSLEPSTTSTGGKLT